MSRGQVEQMLSAAIEKDAALATLASDTLAQLKALSSLLNDKVGQENAPDVRPLHALLTCVAQAMPSSQGTSNDASGDEGADAADRPEGGAGARSRRRWQL